MDFLKNIVKRILPYDLIIVISRMRVAIRSRKEVKKTIDYTERLCSLPKKDVVELVFIVYMPETFSSFTTIYESAMKDSKFSVHVLAQPHVDNQQGILGKNPAYEYLQPIYSNVINAFENNKWYDLEKLSPDYVFYSRPYNHQYYFGYLPENVRKYAKVCLFQYAFDMDKTADFYTVYNYQFLRNVSFVFNSAESTRKKVEKMFPKSNSKYPIIKCLGFPRFELLRREMCKSVSTRKTILWTPRWAAGKKQGKKQTHFFEYIDAFLLFAKEHKNVDFILRPHPLMFSNFIQQRLITQSYIDELYEKSKKLGNVIIDTDKNYFPSIKKADVLISDYSSLIVEFFVLGRPIVYCDDDTTFNYETKRINKTLYHAKNWNTIESYLQKLLAGDDYMLQKRLDEIKVFFDNRNAGQNIIDCIKKDYFGE